MTIEMNIKQFVRDELMAGSGVALENDTPLISSGIVDSIGLLQLIAFVEEQFGLDIDDGDILPDYFETVNDLKAFIESLQA